MLPKVSELQLWSRGKKPVACAGPGPAAPSFALGAVVDLEAPTLMSPGSAAGRGTTPALPAGV